MLLEARGLRVRMQKLDPYINVDPGTMSPTSTVRSTCSTMAARRTRLGPLRTFHQRAALAQFELHDWPNLSFSDRKGNAKGQFLGKTVQVIPHITDEIKSVIRKVAENDVDVVITEIGGTVGDIESLPFLEAIRQYPLVGVKRTVCSFHLTLVPYLKAAGELKTKLHSTRLANYVKLVFSQTF